LDVLINNAGFAQGTSASITEDGFEESFAVMHLAHFHLTQFLLPMLEKTHGNGYVTILFISFLYLFYIFFLKLAHLFISIFLGTIINVASEGHRLLLNTDLFKEYATPIAFAYPRSKLCNVLFTFELHRRLKDKIVVTKIT
jgi:NAD(P)-dependent dehydrogenase (short-subunit alcohol dehydrogenase family)